MLFRQNPAFAADMRFSISHETIIHEEKVLKNPFILVLNKNQFSQPANIPAAFSQMINLPDVYRCVIRPGVTNLSEAEFKRALLETRCGDEILKRYDAYKSALLDRKSKLLIVFDFDLTITSEHTHFAIAQASRKQNRALTPEEQWDIVSQFPPTYTAATWRSLFREAMAAGHVLAIASFNSYPAIIPRYLKEVIGLTDEEVNSFTIFSELPEHPECTDKNEHIEKVKSLAHFKGKNDDIILVDDTLRNIHGAMAKYRVVHAKGDFLTRLKDALDSIQPEPEPEPERASRFGWLFDWCKCKPDKGDPVPSSTMTNTKRC